MAGYLHRQTLVASKISMMEKYKELDELIYRPHRPEQLVTLEGGEDGVPKVHRERHKRFLSFNNDESNIRVRFTSKLSRFSNNYPRRVIGNLSNTSDETLIVIRGQYQHTVPSYLATVMFKTVSPPIYVC